jgi:photolyase PhrII
LAVGYSGLTGEKGRILKVPLPEHLAERTRLVVDRPAPQGGAFVLYWMRTAVRGHENPALDAALLAGKSLGLPVFVYHALSERYPFASDRHHTFILEGACDVQRELGERSVGYAFHLERPGRRGPHLRTLAGRAALVVTEEMPVRPLRQWTSRLAEAATTPVWCVDTACVVPLSVAGRAYERAFEFRRATERARAERISRAWPEIESPGEPFLPQLPFEPLDLRSADLAALVATCEVDHTVGPVPHTRGGSAAGYRRWEAFKRDGLARYAARRNDPLRDGVSRISAYLHYGQVSPFRLAREAARAGSDGAAKFLDELLVWRELAYGFCAFRDDHETLASLPAWARETLELHAADPRPALFDRETLARARTGDALWNAAQRSLLIHGELHNNVRMTWGKALLSWTRDPARALELLIDLNHRYALDGRDPNSYGGILWCLGQFDRPFKPERPILGTVRSRPTDVHAKRLDVGRYARHTARPLFPRAGRIAVVGAGVSGLVCARTLADHGLEVSLFDRGRRPGGRLASRDGHDHGAQYFTARDPRFTGAVAAWVERGLVQPWQGRIVAIENGRRTPKSRGVVRYVGVPENNSVAAHLARDLDVRCNTAVTAIERRGQHWFLLHEGVAGPFATVVVATPAPQAAALLEPVPGLCSVAASVRMRGCWAVMLTFPSSLDAGFDGAFVNGSLSWIARDGSKPGRAGERWMLHASADWTERHLESEPEQVMDTLSAAFVEVAEIDPPEPSRRRAHRWRHAIPETVLAERCLFDDSLGLGACGDWCGGPRIEGAFLSGAAAAGRVLGRLARRSAASPTTLL